MHSTKTILCPSSKDPLVSHKEVNLWNMLSSLVFLWNLYTYWVPIYYRSQLKKLGSWFRSYSTARWNYVTLDPKILEDIPKTNTHLRCLISDLSVRRRQCCKGRESCTQTRCPYCKMNFCSRRLELEEHIRTCTVFSTLKRLCFKSVSSSPTTWPLADIFGWVLHLLLYLSQWILWN